MNDQTRWRTDDAAPLQGKVTLEPAPSVASEAQPPAPARRLEEESFEPLDALDELTDGSRRRAMAVRELLVAVRDVGPEDEVPAEAAR